MPRNLALLLCWCFIAWLYYADKQTKRAFSWTLMIPGLWIAIQGSRPISYWFGSADESGEGNPINTIVLGILMTAGLVVLCRRGFSWSAFSRNNRALLLLYGFLLLSTTWSSEPFVSLKRLIKDFGCVIVALVLLTSHNPLEATKAVFLRVAFVLFPLSIVFSRYFPEIGRNYSIDGTQMITGVATQKNSLGLMLFVLGLVVLWDLLDLRREKDRTHKLAIKIRIGILGWGIWLLITCDSMTSLGCLLLGSLVLWAGRYLARKKIGKSILLASIATAMLLFLVDGVLGISDAVIRGMGRDPSFTGRTDIWRVISEQQTAPLLGEGFYIFWDGVKGRAVIDEMVTLNSAHNGYLEMYLDGGMIGVSLLVLFLFAAATTTFARLFRQSWDGAIGFAFVVAAIVYNHMEASFLRLDPLWTAVLVFSLSVPRMRKAMANPGMPVASRSKVSDTCASFVP